MQRRGEDRKSIWGGKWIVAAIVMPTGPERVAAVLWKGAPTPLASGPGTSAHHTHDRLRRWSRTFLAFSDVRKKRTTPAEWSFSTIEHQVNSQLSGSTPSSHSESNARHAAA